MAMEEMALPRRSLEDLWRRTSVSRSRIIVSWIGAVLVCGDLTGGRFQASVKTGGDAKAANGAPTTPEPAPEPAAPAVPEAAKANVQVSGAKLVVPGGIFFQPDSATFQPGAGNEAVLAEVKTYLDQNTRVTRLRIE